jgi:predicted DNA-binding protein with PD1-like motif
MRYFLLAAGVAIGLANPAYAEGEPSFDYMPSSAVQPGTAPGLKATELSPKTRVFTIEFSKGDDVAAGLADFAEKNHLTNAHFSAIGAFGSAVIGWSDRPKKAFKVVKLDEEMEVAAFNGSITRDKDGKPVVHAHCVVGLLSNGRAYAGHCLTETVSLTLQMYLTDSEPLSPTASAR